MILQDIKSRLNETRNWYIVLTLPRKERKTKETLENKGMISPYHLRKTQMERTSKRNTDSRCKQMRIYLRYRYRARGIKRNISYSSDRNDGSRTLELTLQLEREKGGHRDGIPLFVV